MANLKTTKSTKKNPEVEAVQMEVPEIQVDAPVVADTPTTKEKEENVITEEMPQLEKPDKMVKVRLSKNHKCHIGTENYHFVAGKLYSVPQNVKDILQRANLLTAI